MLIWCWMQGLGQARAICCGDHRLLEHVDLWAHQLLLHEPCQSPWPCRGVRVSFLKHAMFQLFAVDMCSKPPACWRIPCLASMQTWLQMQAWKCMRRYHKKQSSCPKLTQHRLLLSKVQLVLSKVLCKVASPLDHMKLLRVRHELQSSDAASFQKAIGMQRANVQ